MLGEDGVVELREGTTKIVCCACDKLLSRNHDLGLSIIIRCVMLLHM